MVSSVQRMGREMPAPYRHDLHSVVLAHGVPRLCVRNRWRGVRRGPLRNCFQNASRMVLENPGRWVYCEGYAVRPALGIVVGLHAWLLDAQNGWEVIDVTWRDTAGGAYLGIPFSRDYLARSLAESGVYGLIDCWTARPPHPVLRLDPSEYLHRDAGIIPRDFSTQAEEQ